MPREVCQFADTELRNPTSVELVWSKPEGGSNLQLHFQRHNLRLEDGEVAETRVPDPDAPSGMAAELDQFTDQLSRDDCNRLIRALRRARDAVYGPDA